MDPWSGKHPLYTASLCYDVTPVDDSLTKAGVLGDFSERTVQFLRPNVQTEFGKNRAWQTVLRETELKPLQVPAVPLGYLQSLTWAAEEPQRKAEALSVTVLTECRLCVRLLPISKSASAV